MYKILSVLALMACLTTVNAQTSGNQKNVIPPSPRMEAFNIYGNIPVSHHTGVPDISIPLYTLKFEDIEVPITLRYHIRSLKPGGFNDSNVGFGWVLDVGGMVSRTVVGGPDVLTEQVVAAVDDVTGLLNQDSWEGKNFMTGAAAGLINSEHDIFQYSFAGQSGKFLLNKEPTITMIMAGRFKVLRRIVF